ncbi:MAG: redoxin domain-containing protein [Planctomycetes bacterium]|nr:redoxin domain-containing protein [Planctomycetota bacterium]
MTEIPSVDPCACGAAAGGSTLPRLRRGLILCCLAVAVSLGSPAIHAAPPENKTGTAKPTKGDPDQKPGESKNPDQKSDEKPAGDDVEVVTENPFPQRFKSPDLEGGNGWLNVGGEISLKDLRGKVVILDFWTFCCINCMHVLPDLAMLEKKYDKQLVVIGVHSAKFSNEKETENIRRAILRYEISHPVINDSDMLVWQKFRVNSWPTLVLIDPEGYYCGYVSGEGNGEVLDKVIGRLIAYHRHKKTLDESPVRFDLERDKLKAAPLKFPGKLLADPEGKRLFISDSNHNRIVVASLDGKLLDVIGSGGLGRNDGSYTTATFDHPQGLALVGNSLFVADTENHSLREIDLAEKTVRTIAGTGKQGLDRRGGGEGLKTALNSPWDLVHVNGKLYIAMAGPHQIWTYDLKTHAVQAYAGSGREDIINGPLSEAALAQPSGITTDGEFLYVVDSEGSAVRRVPLDPEGEMTTIVGTSNLPRGRSLFEFGDRDGVGADARLQHPLGITWAGGALYVADSYNHKVKRVSPRENSVETYLGDGKSGDRLDPPRFSEPAGLAVAGNVLFVADTNNHQIRKVDLTTGKVEPFVIDGLKPPTPVKPVDSAVVDAARAIPVTPQKLMAGDRIAFEAVLQIPEGFKLNKSAPVLYRVTSEDDQALVASDLLEDRREIEVPEDGSRIKFDLPLAGKSGKAKFVVTVSYSYCRSGAGGLCKLGTQSWQVPVEVSADGKQDVIILPTGKE